MATRPGSPEVNVVLRDGSIVHVCPAKPADAPAVTLLLKGLSDRRRWLRFFSAFPNLVKAARWATEVDDDRRYGLVATVDGGGRMVGHADLERESDRPERAEVALEIADAMQGKGLGTTLLCQLAEAANQLGIQVLDAEVLPENRQMLRVFRDCGYPVKVHSLPEAQLVELRTSLAAHRRGKEDAMARFRTLAAGALFLFGTTFLWFMPSFLGAGTEVEGAVWSVIQLLVLATVMGYAGAAWGLYKTRVWWRPLTIGASILGTVVLLVWWVAVSSLSGVTNMAANLALHAIGIAVLLLLLVPSLGRGLDRRLTGHPRQGT